MKPAVPYYRVSTLRQGRSGLGLEAQRGAVQDYTRGGSWTLLPEVVEVETGTSKRQRPGLAQALAQCRITGATLLIAKLDRLARNVAFVSSLMESGVAFVALDCPHANNFTIHILASVAEHEAKLISERTKAALSAAKARGQKLGTPSNLTRMADGQALGAMASRRLANERARTLADVVRELAPGRSLRQLADVMNERHIRTPRGAQWHPASVARLLKRLTLSSSAA